MLVRIGILKYAILLLLIGYFTTNSKGQQKKKAKEVKINHFDNSTFLLKTTPPKNIFYGNVEIEHENMEMFCDSVVQVQEKNLIKAFGHIHIINADTTHIYGDFLTYDGNTRIAKLRQNIRLTNRNTLLTTQFLDYDMNKNMGFYYRGGTIVDSTNVLTSKIGRYYTQERELFFKDSVKVVTPDYTLYSDTLKYNNLTKTAYILGPTRIVNKTETLYSEAGWYNTTYGFSQFYKNNKLTSKTYVAVGDSIYLDKRNEKVYFRNNVELRDTVNQLILKGNFLETYKSNEHALMTDSTLFIQVVEKDTLFMHADTITLSKDTADFNVIKAFHHMKLFRFDLQAKCDSLVYTMQDSTVRLFQNPIVWAQGNQMTADTIGIQSVNKKVRYLHFRSNSLMVAKKDTNYFDQIKGRNMLGHVKDNKLYKLDVLGNAETTYYPEDKGAIIGMNRAKSSDISIFIENNKIDNILFVKKPDAKLTPLIEIEEEMLYLKGFKWLESSRPKNKMDIFYWNSTAPKLKTKGVNGRIQRIKDYMREVEQPMIQKELKHQMKKVAVEVKKETQKASKKIQERKAEVDFR